MPPLPGTDVARRRARVQRRRRRNHARARDSRRHPGPVRALGAGPAGTGPSWSPSPRTRCGRPSASSAGPSTRRPPAGPTAGTAVSTRRSPPSSRTACRRRPREVRTQRDRPWPARPGAVGGYTRKSTASRSPRRDDSERARLGARRRRCDASGSHPAEQDVAGEGSARSFVRRVGVDDTSWRRADPSHEVPDDGDRLGRLLPRHSVAAVIEDMEFGNISAVGNHVVESHTDR